MSTATAQAMYGWYDSERIEDGKLPKDACKLPHHEVSADGDPGAANLAGVRNAHDAVRAHLQAHLDDAPEDSTDTATTSDVAATDTWAAMTAALTNPQPSTVDGLLERLREGLQ
jgi:hypothetical protein